MMTVVLAAQRDGIAIGVVRAGIEQAGVASIARHAVALEVGDLPGERRRAKLRALMPAHTGLDAHAPRTERRRVGKEWGSPCRCRWSPAPQQKNRPLMTHGKTTSTTDMH